MTLQHPMTLEQHLVLGRYRVLCPADSKKQINAYLGRDELAEGTDVPVVIKEFTHQLGDRSSAAVRALFDELTSLEQLRQPGVVTLLGHEVVRGSLVTVQALSPGTSLMELCASLRRSNEPFPQHLAVYIVRRLLRTLQQCHSHPQRAFIHGRITLGCIHLACPGEPEISDFCLARLEDAAAAIESQLGFFQTRMSYAAPEVPRGGPLTPGGDAYSLALVLYRLLSGSNPLRGRSLAETLQHVLRTTPGSLHLPAWEHCERANAILMRALSKDPAQRYPTCEALADALGAIQTGTDESLNAELTSLVLSKDADWRRVALLAHSLQPARQTHEAECSPPVPRFTSGTPAFASGLITEQPKSVSEHTRRDRDVRRRRRPRRTLVELAGIAAPAALILCGLVLGRLGGASSKVAARAAIAAERVEEGPIRALRARLRGCSEHGDLDIEGVKIELEFVASGKVSAVHLRPSEVAHSRVGGCLLARAWETDVSALGATSIVVELREP
jgi:serine/threonine protein kinase